MRECERAVEGVFGSSLQSILVPTPDDAIRAAAWLKHNHIGRATFLVTGLHGGSDESSVATLYRRFPRVRPRDREYAPVGIDGPRVGDIMKAPRELLQLLERTLPERMNARIVDTLDDATALSLATGDMFVTTDGDWVAGGQFVNAGNGRALEEGAGLLTFKRELRELESRAGELAADLVVAEIAAKDARSRLNGLEESVVLLNASIARGEREAMARELNAGTLQQEVERTERHMRVVIDDATRLTQEQQELEERRVKTMADAEVAQAARHATVERIERTTNRITAIRREAEAESELLNQQRAEAAATAERRRSTASDLRRLLLSAKMSLNAPRDINQEMSEGGERHRQLRASIAEIDRLATMVDEEKAREEEPDCRRYGASHRRARKRRRAWRLNWLS